MILKRRGVISSICSILLMGCISTVAAHYEVQKTEGHVIHVITLNPQDYDAQWVKAGNRLIGRATVAAMAIERQADIAINGGFFEIGDERDGKPTGTLIIDGKVFGRKAKQSCFLKKSGKLSIGSCAQVLTTDGLVAQKDISAVSGIPQLITDGQINPDIFQKKTGFYTKPHARTAIGLKANGELVIVVAENSYAQALKNKAITLHEMLAQETTIVEATGLTLLELARLMQKLGCQSALNLDGGGSSTLWLAGKVVNRAVGDEDEAAGYAVLRPVSDMIAFKKKNHL